MNKIGLLDWFRRIIHLDWDHFIRQVGRVPYIAALSYSFAYVLLVLRNNIYAIPMGEIFIPLIISFMLVHIMYLIFLLFLRDKSTAGLMTLPFTVFMFQFEPLFVKFASTLKKLFPIKSSYDVALLIITVMLCFSLLLVLGWLIKKRVKLLHLLKKFSDVSLGVYLLVTIVPIIFMVISSFRIFSFNPDRHFENIKQTERSVPDIYYFVFDRYGNEQTLNKYYDFSNEEFLTTLSDKGFLINDTTHSNYPYTATSLSSTLNMGYLDQYVGDLPPKYSENIYDNLTDSAEGPRLLRQAGYEHHSVGSWWGATRTNNNADKSYAEPFKLKILGQELVVSDFQDELLRSHMIRRLLAADVPIFSKVTHYEQPTQREIVAYQFNSAKDIVDESQDKNIFAFFHVLSPHPQYVFDKDGSVPKYHKDANYGDIPEKIKYVNQLQYINSQILETVDYILSNSDNPPIIIFQSDEGPYPYKESHTGELEASISRSDRMQWKYGVLSAFHFPGLDERQIDLSPVNIFPFILNNYLGGDFDYLANQNYWYNNKDPYNFENITDLID